MDQCLNCVDHVKNCTCGNTEGYSKTGAICPYCGYLNRADNDEITLYEESTDTYICGECNVEFIVRVSITHSWSTSKINTEEE